MKVYKDPIGYFYLLIYIVLYFFTLNYNYVEGDDASTILYHLCGRNPLIQAPYAAYHSGFDFILRFLPEDETTLREFAVLTSFLFGLFFLYIIRLLLVELLFLKPFSGMPFFVALPFLIPDFIFHSLLINPTAIASSLAMLSILFFIRYLRQKNNLNLVLFLGLFALSIPFRWAMIMLAPAFLGIAIYLKHREVFYLKSFSLLLTKVVALVTFSIFIGILLIQTTGYSFQELIDTILWGKSYNEGERSLLSIVATASAFITPGVVLIFSMGVVVRMKKRNFFNPRIKAFLLWGILSLFPFLLIGYYPSFKYNVVLVPFLVAALYFCFDILSKNKFLHAISLMAIALPWVVGIKLYVSGSAYGAGFEIQNPKHIIEGAINEQDPDSRVGIKTFSLTTKGGFYMPTLEGPRPLYGYFSTLFLGEWYNQIEFSFKEREMIFEKIKSSNYQVQYFQDRKYAVFQADLYRFGFRTNQKFKKENGIPFRSFQNGRDTIKVNLIPSEAADKSKWLVDYASKSEMPMIFRALYSSLILKVLKDGAGEFQYLSPYAVVKNRKDQ